MSSLMLVTNPIKKKGKKMATRKKARTAAQKRATAKLVAANRARRTAKSAPKRRRSVVKTVASTTRRARRSVVTVARRARRSVSRGGSSSILNLIKQAGVGAVGSVVLDVAYSKLPIPDSLKTGNTAPLVKAGVTVGLGLLAGKFLNKNLAHGATVGALTVQLASMLKSHLPASLQGYTDINGIEYYNPALTYDTGVGMYLNDNTGVGEYMSGSTSNYSYNEMY